MTKFFLVGIDGEIISTHETYDCAAGALQDTARDDGVEGAEDHYSIERSGETEIEVVGPEVGECSEEEYEAELDRLESCYTALEDDTRYVVSVRACRSGEASGIYARRLNGTLQILGYSVPVPRDLAGLSERAYNAFCAMPR